MNRYQTKPRGLGLRPTKRSRTKVLGVGYSEGIRDGKPVRYFTANAGTVRKFRIGDDRNAAFRLAVQARATFEKRAS